MHTNSRSLQKKPEFLQPFGPQNLTGRVRKLDKYYIANGSTSDIWRGELLSNEGPAQMVSVVLQPACTIPDH